MEPLCNFTRILMYFISGVFNQERDYTVDDSDDDDKSVNLLSHVHRDFLTDQELKKPSIIVPNVLEAVKSVFQKEGMMFSS